MTDETNNTESNRTGNRLSQVFNNTFSSLSHRNFRLFFIGQLISSTGNWLTRVALILLVLKITASGFAVGLITACELGPVLFLSAWAGAMADRYDKRRLLLWTQSLEMCQSFGLAILAFSPHPPLYGVYTLTLVGGVLLAFDNPFRRSFVLELVPDKDILNSVVLYSIIVNVSRMLGPALAGFLVLNWGYGWSFTIDAFTYLFVLICLYLMRPEEIRRQPGKPQRQGEISEGLRYVMSVPVLWINFVMFAAIGILSSNFSTTLPLFVTDALHSGELEFTILYSVFSLGAVISALIVAHRGLVQMRHIITGAALLGLTMLLLAFMPGVRTAAVAVFLVGMANILYMNATTAIVQVEAQREMHGRVMSFQAILIGGTSLVGGPLSGWLADTLGGRMPLILGGIICLVSATFGYFATRH